VSDAQVLAVAISLGISFLAVLIGVLLNNNRLNDVKEVVNAKVETRAAAKDVYELRVLIEKNHSELLLKLSDIENRFSKFENERRVVQ
jgi:hypothetical protein